MDCFCRPLTSACISIPVCETQQPLSDSGLSYPAWTETYRILTISDRESINRLKERGLRFQPGRGGGCPLLFQSGQYSLNQARAVCCYNNCSPSIANGQVTEKWRVTYSHPRRWVTESTPREKKNKLIARVRLVSKHKQTQIRARCAQGPV